MKKFNLKEHIAKNKATFFSSLNENASNTAEKFAQHMSKKEGKKFTVTPGSVDEKSFDLDVDGEKYMGGSYLIKDNGDIVNVAMGNEVYGNVNQLEEGDLMKNIGKGLDYEATEEMIRDYASGLFGDTYEPEDLADFYLQNPSAFPKSLNHDFFKNNYDDILSLAMTGLDEGKAAYEYEKGKKEGETIEKNKMKKSELKAKIKEQTGQLKKGDKVNYDGEKNLIVNILKDGSPVLVPMSSIDDEAFSVDSDEISNPKLYFKVNYDGEKHLVVNILDDGSPVLVPMSVIDDEAFSIDSDEIETPMTENVTTKMKKSELKAKIKEIIVAEMNIDVTDETGAYDFLAELEGMLEQEEEEIEDEVEVDIEEPTSEPKGGINVSQNADADLTGIEKQVQDNLEAAMEAAKQLNDEKLQQQIGNSLTFFTRQHVVKETKEALNEDLTSTITILLAFLIGIPGVPIAGALIMGLINYLFNELPDQRAEAKSLRSYKGPDKQEKVLALAKEIESKLSPGKKRYLKTLVSRIGAAKLEDKAREYRELDRYASSQKSQMDRGLDENLSADIKAALKDLPVPTNMEEGEEPLNEDLTSTITILLAFLIGIPGVPIAGALMMGLVDYIFNGLPDQYNEYRSLKSYKGPDKQAEILALAKEIESKLSPGKKRYLKTLVNRIGVSKLEDKARAYRELDRYASGEKSQIDNMNENLNADIEAALKDLPVPTDMGEGKEKDLNESMFPMLKKILK